MGEDKDVQSNFHKTASVVSFGSVLPRYIVELVAIICTSLKSVFWVVSAAETRIVLWKVTPVHWKGSFVQWKVTRSAAESWSSHHRLPYRLLPMMSWISTFLAITFLVRINHNLTNLLGVI